MPMDYDGMRTGDESERTDNVTDYKRTCIDFIEVNVVIIRIIATHSNGMINRTDNFEDFISIHNIFWVM